MRHPDEVTAYLRERFTRGYPDWARGAGTWPMRIPLHPPDTSQREADPVACHAWAAAWNKYEGPGRVERPPAVQHRNTPDAERARPAPAR